MPFIPGRVAEVNQTVEAAGVTVRLERVVVTPSETRVIVCFEPPDGGQREWAPILTLEAGNEQHVAATVSRPFYESGQEGCYRSSFLASLHDQRGEWTLTVSELVGEDISRLESQILRQADSAVVEMDAVEATEFQTRLAGPWVFRFRVP